MTLSPDDLNETDQQIIEKLQEGRVTPRFLADELNISRPYASDRLKRFLEHNIVRRLAPGLYELVPENVPMDRLE